MKKIIFEMLIGHEHFHTECEYHAAKKTPVCFRSRSFALQRNTSSNHDGDAEQKNTPPMTTTTTDKLADKLIISVSWRQALFDR